MLYDFYYSKKCEECLILSSIRTQSARTRTYVETRINGKKYTEAIKTGEKPLSNYDDLEFICTEDESKITCH